MAIDATTPEANAPMRTIVCTDSNENWKYLNGWVTTDGLENPTDDELRRFDKKKRKKKVADQG